MTFCRSRRWVHETDFSCRLVIDLPVDDLSCGRCHGGFRPGKTDSRCNRGKTSDGQKKRSGPKRSPVASKSKPASEVVKTKLPPANLDLSLPKDKVEELKPVGTVPLPRHDAVLPQMFGGKSSPFQLNGRLISNEMQLQRRNEERREVEGAALEFEFKQ